MAKVLDSHDPNFAAGDLVEGITGWEEYSLITKTDRLRKIEKNGVPLSYHVGLLGRKLVFYCDKLFEACDVFILQCKKNY